MYVGVDQTPRFPKQSYTTSKMLSSSSLRVVALATTLLFYRPMEWKVMALPLPPVGDDKTNSNPRNAISSNPINYRERRIKQKTPQDSHGIDILVPPSWKNETKDQEHENVTANNVTTIDTEGYNSSAPSLHPTVRGSSTPTLIPNSTTTSPAPSNSTTISNINSTAFNATDSNTSIPIAHIPSVRPSPSPSATTAKPTYSPLPLREINILVLTDVHSWVQGHARHESPSLDVDYGDVLSFYQRLRQMTQRGENERDRDLYFVMNGDFVHGTLLGADPPNYLSGILERMPYDAVNLGNHDVNNEETWEVLSQPGGLIDLWGERLVTSNLRRTNDGDESLLLPVGSNYRFLRGTQGTVLALGFLYNMGDDAVVTVERVQDVVEESWFRTLFGSPRQEEFDAVLVLAHMDAEDELVVFLHSQLRALVGEEMVIQFVTGHSHLRRYVELDPRSSSFEAGRYLDTVGFVSFDIDEGGFQHVFIDANRESLAQSLGMSVEDYPTEDGKELTMYIQRTFEHAGANVILGCSPRRYRVDGYLNETDSLMQLFMGEVLPKMFLQTFDRGSGSSFGRSEKVLMQAQDWFVRYDLFPGMVTVGDVFEVLPEDDVITQLSHSLYGGDIIKLWEAYNNNRMFMDNTTYVVGIATEHPKTPEGQPNYPELENDSKYTLYCLSKDASGIIQILSDLGFSTHAMEEDVYRGTRTVRDLWIDYIREEWPYDGNDCHGPTDRGPDATASPGIDGDSTHVSVPSGPHPTQGVGNDDGNNIGDTHSSSKGSAHQTSSSSGGFGSTGSMAIVLLALCFVSYFGIRHHRRRGQYSTPRDIGVRNDLELQVVRDPPQGYGDLGGGGGGYASPALASGRYV